MDLKDIIAVFLSIFALVIAILSYNRGRRFDNENYLHKFKLDTYTEILGALQHLINTMSDGANILKELEKKTSDFYLKELNKNADKIDNACFSLNDLAVTKSLAIPQGVLLKLKIFCQKAMLSPIADEFSASETNISQKFEICLSQLIADADDIVRAFRKDLNIDTLHQSLYKRLVEKQ